MNLNAVENLLNRAERVLTRLEAVLPHPLGCARLGCLGSPSATASARALATPALAKVSLICLSDLKEVDAQKERLARNTEQFVAGASATMCCSPGTRHRQEFADQGLPERARLLEACV